jgi:tetratricopeptide (TPR) repeat protein
MGKQGFLILWVFLMSGCSSKFVVKSDPLQAEVSFQDSKSGEKKPLGKTPFEMPNTVLRQALGENLVSGEYFTLIVEKQGYQTEKILVPASRFETLITSLNVKLKQGDNAAEEKLAKDILNHLFLAQKLASSRQYERAQIELEKILTVAPEFPRALSMRASIYFMQKNYTESLKWYDSALKADPQMEDAIQMTAKIQKMESGRP